MKIDYESWRCEKMLSEREVRILLNRAKQTKVATKRIGTDESYRVVCKAVQLLEKILEIEPKGKIDRRHKIKK